MKKKKFSESQIITVLKESGNQVIVSLLKSYSAEYPTYGFGKLFNLIRLKNYPFNHKRVYRIYCELKLNLKIKPKKRLASRIAIQLQQPDSNIITRKDPMKL